MLQPGLRCLSMVAPEQAAEPFPAGNQTSAVGRNPKSRGERHNEVGTPDFRIDRLLRLCPDAPGFLNLIPGTWTGTLFAPAQSLYQRSECPAKGMSKRPALLRRFCRFSQQDETSVYF